MGGIFGSSDSGSTGGGGGGSGTVAYPAYMQSQHEHWLDELDNLITDAVSGVNPFTTITAYDPDVTLDEMDVKLATFNAIVAAFDPTTDWQTIFDSVDTKLSARLFDDDRMEDLITAHAAVIRDELDDQILPRFNAGLQSVNAAMTSAFVIGKANILAKHDRDVDLFAGNLRYQNNLTKTQAILMTSDSLLKITLQHVDFYRTVAHYGMEATRLRTVAKKEETEINVGLDEKDARWDLEMYTYGGNMLAAIGGGTVGPAGSQLSTGQSAIGGALSGASVGYQISGNSGWGALAGGVLGAIAGSG